MNGYLDKGQWHDGWYDTRATHGEFVRLPVDAPDPDRAGAKRPGTSSPCPSSSR